MLKPPKQLMAWLIVGTAVTTGVSEAYNLKDVNWKYMAHPMGKDFEICATGMPSGAVNRIKEGAASWNYAKFKFSFKSNGCSSAGQYPKDNGVNQIDYATMEETTPITLAQTYTWFKANTDKIVECDMRFNDQAKWNATTNDPKADEYDWLSVATHEMGHCLGLDHSDVANAVMFKSFDPGAKRRALKKDDTDGRAAIYGN